MKPFNKTNDSNDLDYILSHWMSSSPFLTPLFHFIQCIEVRGEIRENRTIQVVVFERNFDIIFLGLTSKKILNLNFFRFPSSSVLFKIVCYNYLSTYKVNNTFIKAVECMYTYSDSDAVRRLL